MRGSLYVPKGYILANGAEVLRADYPRLVAFADENELWVDSQTKTRTVTIDATVCSDTQYLAVSDVSVLDDLRVGDTVTGEGIASGSTIVGLSPFEVTSELLNISWNIELSAACTVSQGSTVTLKVDRVDSKYGLFGVGDGETTFSLPNYIDRMVQFSSGFGDSIDAGLPNVTGALCRLFTTSARGAFYAASYVAQPTISTSTNLGYTGRYTFGFNAANSNSIYGNSDTVQPPAITLYPIMRY